MCDFHKVVIFPYYFFFPRSRCVRAHAVERGSHIRKNLEQSVEGLCGISVYIYF